jgi:hypothetical protein
MRLVIIYAIKTSLSNVCIMFALDELLYNQNIHFMWNEVARWIYLITKKIRRVDC